MGGCGVGFTPTTEDSGVSPTWFAGLGATVILEGHRVQLEDVYVHGACDPARTSELVDGTVAAQHCPEAALEAEHARLRSECAAVHREAGLARAATGAELRCERVQRAAVGAR